VDKQDVVDDDGHRQIQQPGAVFAVRCQRRTPLEKAARKSARLLRAELCVIAWAHVAQIAGEVHGLVVTMDHVHVASGGRGLRVQAHQQVHHLFAVVAAIQQVAERHEMRVTAAPTQLGIHQARALQERDQLVIGTVNVADHDDAIDVLEVIGRGPKRWPTREQAQPQQPDHAECLLTDVA